MSDKLMLIDGNSIINRAFYGVPDLTNHEGLHTNAIYGFLNIFHKLLADEKPTHVLVAFDEKAPTFRHKMYDGYKGTRKPMPEELAEQMPVLKEVLGAMQVEFYSKAGIEADDILGTMSLEGKKAGLEVTVVSGDRDLLQLVDDVVTVRLPKSKGGKTEVIVYDKSSVIRDFKVTPPQIIDLKALMGDSSDNIPGIPGVGEKTAISLLDTYGTVEAVLKNAEDIKNARAKTAVLKGKEYAMLSKDLATIKRDCELEVSLEDCKLKDIWNEDAYKAIERLEFKSILAKFESGTGGGSVEFTSKTVSDDIKDLNAFLAGLKKGDVLSVKLVRADEGLKTAADGQMTLFQADAGYSLIGASLALSDGSVGFFSTGNSLSEQDMLSVIGEKIRSGSILVANDIKNDLEYFPDLTPDNCFDTNIAAYLLRPTDKAFTEEDIAFSSLGISVNTYSQEFGKKSVSTAWEEDRDDLINYFCTCSFVNIKGYDYFREELKKTGMKKVFDEIEMPLIFVLYDMEKEGILIKRDTLKEYSEKLGESLKELEKEIYERAGEEFNIQSPKQLGVILFEKMHMPYGKKTKTGYSTSAEVLEKLRFEDPIIEMILKYRQLSKLKSTYADGLDAFIDDDGRIRTTFNQNVTATGRLSSTDPNMQNIPIRVELGREIRKVFVPKEGCIFLDADYSQIELRVLAHMSEDEKLIDAYRQDADIHRLTASQVFGVPFDEVTEAQRRGAKAVNFGIVYGISGFGLSRDLDISQKQAKQYIDDYFKTYPGVKSFLDKLVESAKTKGYAKSMYGRRRPIPELSSKNFMQRSFGERIAMNSPVQGSAADIIKIAMIRVWKRLRDEGLKSKLILQVHDELLVETAEDEVDEVERILNEEMTGVCELSVPLIAEVGKGKNWGEAH
ncbi:MAG: DNA polymerase I [Eubacterium sp.]|nr:DNA polymerase I [Eubacterium sp.]